MTLYRLTTYVGGPLYAARIPEFQGAVKLVPRVGSATLFRRDEAQAIAKRLKKKPLSLKLKLEPV